MTGPGCVHAHSKRQLRFFGAVAGGQATKPTSMTQKEAKHHIKMAEKEGRDLPESKARRGLRRMAKRGKE